MATQTMPNTNTNTARLNIVKMKFLRAMLYADEVSVLISGLLLIFAAAPIAEFLGIQETPVLFFDGTGFLRLIGVGFFIFAGGVFLAARESVLDPAKVKIIIALNLGWCVASWLLLLTQALPLTTAGSWAVLLIADAVLVIALLEIWGLRRLSR